MNQAVVNIGRGEQCFEGTPFALELDLKGPGLLRPYFTAFVIASCSAGGPGWLWRPAGVS